MGKYSTGADASLFLKNILELIKPVYKFGVVDTASNLTPLKQNMLWYFARQLDSNNDYSTDTSA